MKQVAFFGNEFFQFFRHFVELDGKVGQFVVAVIHLLGNTGFKFAVCHPVHTAAQDLDGFGDVAGEDVRHQQTDDDDEG